MLPISMLAKQKYKKEGILITYLKNSPNVCKNNENEFKIRLKSQKKDEYSQEYILERNNDSNNYIEKFILEEILSYREPNTEIILKIPKEKLNSEDINTIAGFTLDKSSKKDFIIIYLKFE